MSNLFDIGDRVQLVGPYIEDELYNHWEVVGHIPLSNSVHSNTIHKLCNVVDPGRYQDVYNSGIYPDARIPFAKKGNILPEVLDASVPVVRLVTSDMITLDIGYYRDKKINVLLT